MQLTRNIDGLSRLQKTSPKKKMNNYRARNKESVKKELRKVATIAAQMTDHLLKPEKEP